MDGISWTATFRIFEITPNGAGLGLFRVSGAVEGAYLLDGILTLEDDGQCFTFAHGLDKARKEVFVDMFGVEFTNLLVCEGERFVPDTL